MRRRTFLETLGAVAVVAAGTRATAAERTTTPFNVLVLGDSIAWGQGLIDDHRWRTLVVGRLNDAFLQRGVPRTAVELASEIHSGATIGLGDRDQIEEHPHDGISYDAYAPRYADAQANAPAIAPSGLAEHSYLTQAGPIAGEIPSSTPTVLRQIDDFDAGPDRDALVDLVVLSASINDVSVARLLDPLADRRYVAELIETHCHRHLLALLDRIRVRFVDPNPSCIVVVLSYYPMIGPDSLALPSTNEILKALLSSPTLTQAQARERAPVERGASIVTGGRLGALGGDDARAATDQAKASAQQALVERKQGLIVKALVAAANRFFSASQAAIHHAVEDANRKPFAPAFVHVTPGIDPALTTFTIEPHPQLWSLQTGVFEAQDEVAVARDELCSLLASEPRDLDPSAVRGCYVASIGHPDIAGAERYADAIWDAIRDRTPGA